ncbi:MAG: hypothetical protein WCH99_20100 [Verrucomicrobiota bacterium]
MTDREHKYWAFLSFSHQDNGEPRSDSSAMGRRGWGNWLHDALKTFSIPPEFIGQINGRGEIIPERMDAIFRDESELAADASLSAEVRQALEQSICLIVICSPRSAQSRQVNEVVRYFKQLGRGKYILPIVIAGEPNASAGNQSSLSPADECFVPALRHPVSPEGTLDATRPAGRSLFVDARYSVDKREILANDHRHAEADLEMAKIQLIALLLGVGFNGLWWREQKRHFFDLAEAQRQAQAALNQVEDVRRQLEAAQLQTREVQQQALELQNLPRDVQGQIQAAQNHAQEVEKQLQEFQNQVRATQTQLEETRHRALAAESKVLEAQQQARNTHNQLETTRQQVQDAQNNFLAAQSQVQEFQNQAQSAQSQLEAAHHQNRETQGKILEAQSEARAAQNQVQEIQNQTQDVQGQIQAAQNQVRKIQDQSRSARRLTKVFALLAVLAILAAGQALRQRQLATQALAKATSEAAGKFNLATDGLNPEQIRQVLQNIGGAAQAENQRRSLNELAATIPCEEIPEALKASAVIWDDQQRSHFQKWLLVRLGWVNPLSAMTCASAVAGNIVNDAGASDSNRYFQLAVLDNWMQTDLPGACHWVGQLPDYDFRPLALEKIIWWAQSQPDSDAKNQALKTGVFELAKTDVPAAMALAKSLPATAGRNAVLVSLWMQTDPFAVWDWLNRLDVPPAMLELEKAPWPWVKFLPNANFADLEIFPVETEILSSTTNAPLEITPKD